jgi:hypothetical protein
MQCVNERTMADPWADLANMQGYMNEIQPSQPCSLEGNQGSQASLDGLAAGQSASKRQVSSNACEPCRKRKSKVRSGSQQTLQACLTKLSVMA